MKNTEPLQDGMGGRSHSSLLYLRCHSSTTNYSAAQSAIDCHRSLRNRKTYVFFM